MRIDATQYAMQPLRMQPEVSLPLLAVQCSR